MARTGCLVVLGILASCTGYAVSPVVEGSPAAPSSRWVGRLKPTASMSTSRAVHTATTLADGSILVAGGCTAPGCEVGSPAGATAEVYDPEGLQFSSTRRMGVSRDDHTATPLRDGRVLLAGGWGAGGVLVSTELYDPATEAFTPGPRMRSRRAGFTATLLRDGRVLLAGGFVDNDRTVADAEIFDPRSDKMMPRRTYDRPARWPLGRPFGRRARTHNRRPERWARDRRSRDLRPPHRPVHSDRTLDHASLQDGDCDAEERDRVGDRRVRGRRANSIVRHNRALRFPQGTFARGPRMHFARYKLAGSVVRFSTGDVLVAGGAEQAEIYDAATRRFHLVSGNVDGDRLFLAASRLSRDRALLTGGYDAGITPTAKAWVYR